MGTKKTECRRSMLESIASRIVLDYPSWKSTFQVLFYAIRQILFIELETESETGSDDGSQAQAGLA